MQIFIAADHAGYELKRELKEFLKAEGYTVHDEGFFEFNEDDDYPDVVTIVAKQVGSDPAGSRGIVIGGSGQGEAMCANRAPQCSTLTMRTLSVSPASTTMPTCSHSARASSLQRTLNALSSSG